MHVEDHLPPEELQRLAQAIPQKRIWRRFQAVLLARQGQAAVEIARNLGCSPRAVQEWITQYNRGGPTALQERPHPGRPPAWPGTSGISSASGWRPGHAPRIASAPSTSPISEASSSRSSASGWAARRPTTCCTALASAV